MNETFGYPPDRWSQAKDEAKDVLIRVARQKSTVSYSDLVANIHGITLEPRDPRLDTLLCQISEEEDVAGRGMLSVVVVHKQGDQLPGPGFFQLAKQRGYGVTDNVQFWVEMLRRVYASWDDRPSSGEL